MVPDNSDDGENLGSNPSGGSSVGRGHVKIFRLISGIWTQLGGDIDGEGFGDEFGSSVSINATGDVIAVGAYYNDGESGSNPSNNANNGSVRVYEWDGTSWKMRGLEINGEHTGDLFGYSISLNSTGDVVAVGAPHDADTGQQNAGSVSVYQYNGIKWNKLGDNKVEHKILRILVLQCQ